MPEDTKGVSAVINFILALLVALQSTASSAADDLQATQEPQTISLGPEFVPRFAALHPSESLVVPEGETYTVYAPAEYHTIEVAGTLVFSDHCAPITLKCVNIQVLPTGTVEMGTDELPFLGQLEIIIKDEPLDYEHDPYGWGNGIICLGKWYANGIEPDPWMIDGDTPRFSPTRNITIRSENPSGTRGHTVVTKHGYAEVRNVAFLDMGRTLPVDLDSTVENDDGTYTIGTNQIARYVFHWHHNHPMEMTEDPTGVLSGCYVDSGNVNKWGVVIHGTNDVLVTNNVVTRLQGAGIATEDGNEIGNVITNNLLVGVKGTDRNDKFNLVSGRNNPGAAGSGIWLQGMTDSIVSNNVAVDCSIGFQGFNNRRGFKDEFLSFRSNNSPQEFDGNTAIECQVGLETWNTPGDFTVTNFESEGGSVAIMMGSGEPGSITLIDSVLRNAKDSGIKSSRAYTTSVNLYNCEIDNCEWGLASAGTMRIENCDLHDSQIADITDVFRPYDMVVTDSQIEKFVLKDHPNYNKQRNYASWVRDNPIRVNNWNGDGNSYLLIEPTQDENEPAYVGMQNGKPFGAPTEGYTLGTLYEAFGTMFKGTPPVDYTSLKVLPGLVNGRGLLIEN